jgi:hypothetical protein
MNYESSTDDEDYTKPCIIEKTVIYSNYSNDSKLKFSEGSFSFDLKDNIFFIQIHPMFLWRLVKNKDVKIKAYVSQHLTNQCIIYLHPTCAFYNNVKRETEREMYNEITTLYNRLFFSITRNYKNTNILEELLDKSVDIFIQLICL